MIRWDFLYTRNSQSIPQNRNKSLSYCTTKAQTEGIQGRVTVQFIVDEDGHIIEPNIVGSIEPSLDNEALRLIKMLSQWKPGTLKGKAVKAAMKQTHSDSDIRCPKTRECIKTGTFSSYEGNRQKDN